MLSNYYNLNNLTYSCWSVTAYYIVFLSRVKRVTFFFRSFIFNGTPSVLIRLHGFAKVWRRRRRRFQGGDYSSLTAALIDLIFGMHTPIRSIGVVGYMNLTFEVIKGHLWEIFPKTSDDTRSYWTVETFFFLLQSTKS